MNAANSTLVIKLTLLAADGGPAPDADARYHGRARSCVAVLPIGHVYFALGGRPATF